LRGKYLFRSLGTNFVPDFEISFATFKKATLTTRHHASCFAKREEECPHSQIWDGLVGTPVSVSKGSNWFVYSGTCKVSTGALKKKIFLPFFAQSMKEQHTPNPPSVLGRILEGECLPPK